MAKKSKLGTFGLIMLIVAAVGLVLAVVGFAIPWFTAKSEVLGKTSSEGYGLFKLDASKDKSDFPLAAVQAFGTIGFIFSVVACAFVVLEGLGILKPNRIMNIVVAALTVLCAALGMIFAITYASQYGSAGVEGLASGSFVTNAGSYLLLVGAIMTSVPLLLPRK